MLATSQQHSSAVVTVPDFDLLPEGQIRDWEFASMLLGGNVAVVTYADGDCIFVELDPGTGYLLRDLDEGSRNQLCSA